MVSHARWDDDFAPDPLDDAAWRRAGPFASVPHIHLVDSDPHLYLREHEYCYKKDALRWHSYQPYVIRPRWWSCKTVTRYVKVTRQATGNSPAVTIATWALDLECGHARCAQLRANFKDVWRLQLSLAQWLERRDMCVSGQVTRIAGDIILEVAQHPRPRWRKVGAVTCCRRMWVTLVVAAGRAL